MHRRVDDPRFRRAGALASDGQRYLVLSHPLTPAAPVWPGNPPAARVRPSASIVRGDVANTTELGLFSHSGTHVDTPWHFDDAGPSAIELPIDAFTFDRPVVLDLPHPDGDPIVRAEVALHAAALTAADILFLRTGWSVHRQTQPERYIHDGPYLDPDAARFLIDTFEHLRAVAIDAISIGTPRDRDVSTDTHRILAGTGRQDGRFLLAFEDLRIEPAVARAIRVFAWPLFVEGADGSPLTMVAELAAER
jgi:arylformamidase